MEQQLAACPRLRRREALGRRGVPRTRRDAHVAMALPRGVRCRPQSQRTVRNRRRCTHGDRGGRQSRARSKRSHHFWRRRAAGGLEHHAPRRLGGTAEQRGVRAQEAVLQRGERVRWQVHTAQHVLVQVLRGVLRGVGAAVAVKHAIVAVGDAALLDAVVDYMPSPLDVEAIKGTDVDGEVPMVRESSDDEPNVEAAR